MEEIPYFNAPWLFRPSFGLSPLTRPSNPGPAPPIQEDPHRDSLPYTYTLWVMLFRFWACDGHEPIIKSPEPAQHNMGPKCVWVSSMDWAKGRKGKEEASSTFVLPPITSMCTYNVGAVPMLSECTRLFNVNTLL